MRGILFLLSVLLSAASAEDLAGPKFQANFWLGHKGRFGRWNTLWIEVTTGKEGCKGVLAYVNPDTSAGTFEKALAAPPHAKLRIPFCVIPKGGDGRLIFTPEGCGKKWREPPPKDIPLTTLGWIQKDTHTIGVLGAVQVSLGSEELIPADAARVAHLLGGGLPDQPRGFESLDALVWADPEVDEMNVAGMAALRQWLLEGGELVVIPGKNWRGLEGCPLAKILPSLPGFPKEETDWQALAGKVGNATSPRGKAFRWPLSQAPASLWHTSRLGFGRVTILGFDPDDAPFRNWPGLGKFWRDVTGVQLETEDEVTDGKQGGIPVAGEKALAQKVRINVGNALLAKRFSAFKDSFWRHFSEFRGVEAIGFGKILLFLAAYVLVIGPLDYLVLKRMDRLEWTWLTFPLVVGLAIAIAAWWATTAKGHRFVSSSLTVLDLAPGATHARKQEFVRVFTPRATRIRVRCQDPDSYALPAEEPGYAPSASLCIEEADCSILELPSQQWSVTSFQTRSAIEHSGGVTLSVNDPSDVPMSLTNHTPFSFQIAYVLWKGRVHRLEGGPSAGQSAELPPWGDRWLFAMLPEKTLVPGGDISRVPGNAYGSGYRFPRESLLLESAYIFYWRLPGKEPGKKINVGGREYEQAEVVYVNPEGQPCPTRRFSTPDTFPLPGRSDEDFAVFAGLTNDLASSFEIEGHKVTRQHAGMVRALIRVEKP